MKSLLVIFLSTAVAVGIVSAASSGAPAVACGTMTPAHGSQQPLPAPYKIEPASTSMSSSEALPIRLSADADHMFKGFLLMARASGSSDTTPIGTFLSVDNEGRTSDCDPGTSTAVTHASSLVRTEVNAVWQPPAGYQGTVTFWATFCQDFTKWWANNTSVDVEITP